MKKPKLKRDWIGRKVRTLVELRSGIATIPLGAILEVYGNRGGLFLRSDACPHCGVMVHVRGVPEWDVEVLTEAPPAGA